MGLRRKVAKVILWSNGFVSVFDSRGKPLSQFQGDYPFVVDSIRKHAEHDTKYYEGRWKDRLILITEEQFYGHDRL